MGSMVEERRQQLLHESARSLLAAAIEAEIRHFKRAVDDPGRGRRRDSVARNGFHPERMVITGIGALPVRLPKVRRRGSTPARFRSALVPRYARRARSLSDDASEQYLRAISRGDLREALAALVGPRAAGLPPPVVRQLQDWWLEQCAQWRPALDAQIGAPLHQT